MANEKAPAESATACSQPNNTGDLRSNASHFLLAFAFRSFSLLHPLPTHWDLSETFIVAINLDNVSGNPRFSIIYKQSHS